MSNRLPTSLFSRITEDLSTSLAYNFTFLSDDLKFTDLPCCHNYHTKTELNLALFKDQSRKFLFYCQILARQAEILKKTSKLISRFFCSPVQCCV